MKKELSRLFGGRLIPLVIILLFGIGIFAYINGKLLFNPDFGESDVYHGYGARLNLYESIRYNRLPFWTDKWLGGFPFLSDWQTGSLYFPNLILYKLLPFDKAVDADIAFTYIILSSGFYLLLRELKINKLTALILSVSFPFTGSIAFRLTHTPLLAAFSYVPLVFFLALKYINTCKIRFMLILPFVATQIVYSGFAPVFFLLSSGLYPFVFIYTRYIRIPSLRETVRIYLMITLSLAASVLLSMPQLLPSLKLSSLGSRTFQLDFETITAFPFQMKNMISFVYPYLFGNPKSGSYPRFDMNWGIFWENTPYVGLIFSLVFIFALIYSLTRKDKINRFILNNCLLILFFIILALGKNSPFYFLFEFPPFYLFRTQSRYLIMACFFIFILAGLCLNKMYTKSGTLIKFAIFLLLIINLADLMYVQKNYHLFIDSERVLDKPELAGYIDDKSSYMTFGQPKIWNNVFLSGGWSNENGVNKYLFYKNFLYPNSNFLFHKKIYDISHGLGFTPRRNEFLKSLLSQNLETAILTKSLPAGTLNLMRLLSINYLISSAEINIAELTNVKSAEFDNEKIYLYRVKDGSPQTNYSYYSPHTVQEITGLSEFEYLKSKDNDFLKNAVIENPIGGNKNVYLEYRIENMKEEEDRFNLTADFKNSGLLVFKKNYFPGWTLTLDGQNKEIEKVNLVHMGVFVPEGRHIISLQFNNTDFRKGVGIAFISYPVFGLLIILLHKSRKFISE